MNKKSIAACFSNIFDIYCCNWGGGVPKSIWAFRDPMRSIPAHISTSRIFALYVTYFLVGDVLSENKDNVLIFYIKRTVF